MSASCCDVKVLVACEFSGMVRDAFLAAGHDAWSCDLLPSERPGPHLQDDVRRHLEDGWDLMIAFPPCTYLARSGARWWSEPERQAQAEMAIAFVRALYDSPIPRVAIENPIGMLNQRWRYPDQVVDPSYFGDEYSKRTCLWLRGVPPLMATLVMPEAVSLIQGSTFCRVSRKRRVTYGARDPQERSRTLPGIAAAMAAQWGA